MSLSVAGAEALSAGLGFGASVFGSTASGLFGANQAAKNRKFQEKMYNRQVEDSIKFWKMQNEYNTPSAQLERIRQAGMNPLLLYGEGGLSGNLAQQSPDLPSAPHGAQGQAQIATRLDMANIALLEAQAKNIEKDTELKGQEISESQSRANLNSFDLMFKRLSKDIDLALKYHQGDLFNSQIRDLNSQIWTRENLSTQNILSMMQSRLYEIKRFGLDEYRTVNETLQGWKQVENGQIMAKASTQQAFAALMNAVTTRQIMPYQIGVLNNNAKLLYEQAVNERKFRPFRIQGLKADNFNTWFDTLTKGANLSKIGAETLETQLRTLKSSLGVDSYLGGVLAPFTMPLGFSQHGKNYLKLKTQYGW